MAQDVTVTPNYSTVQPGAYSSIDASQLASANELARRPIVAVIGTALGGASRAPMYFRGSGQLRQVIRGGPAYDVARFAFSGGASQVCVVRVGSVAQGTLALAGASGTALTLTSKDYGTWVNSIKVTVAANNVITLTYTDPLGVAYTEKWDFSNLSPTVQNIVDAINGKTYGFTGSNYVTATAGAGTLPLATASAQPLAGGADGLTPQASDWTAGLQALEAENIDIVVPATGDATVHAQVLTHCQNMSLPAARQERTTVVGGVLGESVSAVSARLASLRDKRLQLVYPGVQDYDSNGNLVQWDPFYAAGKIAGMHAGLPDEATSLTHKLVPVVDVETKLSTVAGGAIDQLLLAGVTPIAPAPRGGFWVVDSITGYNTDDTFRDFHKIRSADVVAARARLALEQAFVGGKSLDGTANQITAAANQVLAQLQTQELIRSYKPAVVSPGPNAKTYNVSLPVMLVDTTKYIYINVVLQPSSTVSSDVGFTAQDALT